MKSPVQKLVQKLDDTASAKVKKNAKYRCERCGAAGAQIGGDRTLHWAHIAGRGKRQTRWGFYIKGKYFWNAVALCGGDHMWLDNAENRLETTDWLESKFGRMTMQILKEESRKTEPWGVKKLAKKLEELSTV